MIVKMLIASLLIIPISGCLAVNDLPLSGTVIEVKPASSVPVKLNIAEPNYASRVNATLTTEDGSCSFDVTLIGSSGRVEQGKCKGQEINKGYVNAMIKLDTEGKPFLDKAYIYTWKS
ncbi:TPA: hypothetical protein ACF227_003172 [Klebsiella pneumoniae]